MAEGVQELAAKPRGPEFHPEDSRGRRELAVGCPLSAVWVLRQTTSK